MAERLLARRLEFLGFTGVLSDFPPGDASLFTLVWNC